MKWKHQLQVQRHPSHSWSLRVTSATIYFLLQNHANSFFAQKSQKRGRGHLPPHWNPPLHIPAPISLATALSHLTLSLREDGFQNGSWSGYLGLEPAYEEICTSPLRIPRNSREKETVPSSTPQHDWMQLYKDSRNGKQNKISNRHFGKKEIWKYRYSNVKSASPEAKQHV